MFKVSFICLFPRNRFSTNCKSFSVDMKLCGWAIHTIQYRVHNIQNIIMIAQWSEIPINVDFSNWNWLGDLRLVVRQPIFRRRESLYIDTMQLVYRFHDTYINAFIFVECLMRRGFHSIFNRRLKDRTHEAEIYNSVALVDWITFFSSFNYISLYHSLV